MHRYLSEYIKDKRFRITMIGIAFAEVQAMPWMQYKRPWAQVSNDATQVFRMLMDALRNSKEKGYHY